MSSSILRDRSIITLPPSFLMHNLKSPYPGARNFSRGIFKIFGKIPQKLKKFFRQEGDLSFNPPFWLRA